MAGWREAMQKIGEENIDELIVDSCIKPFDNSILRSFEFFSKWLARPHAKFTAVFCAASTGGVSVLRALREYGIRVPQGASVISHGGESQIAPFLVPSLTAVETDLTDYGQQVVDLLERQLNDPTHPVEQLTVPSSLVVRESTARIKR